MEVELKYKINDSEIALSIFEYILRICDSKKTPIQRKNMIAIYYDTFDEDLKENKIVFRTRKEGDDYIATIKYGGDAQNGLHIRNEINVTISELQLNNPSINMFDKSNDFKNIIKKMPIVDSFKPIIRMEFYRDFITVKFNNSIIECSYDNGNMKNSANNSNHISYFDKQILISELEMELIDGLKEDLCELGAIVKKEFSLQIENKSKFERCFA